MKPFNNKFFFTIVFLFFLILIGDPSIGYCDTSQAWLTNTATFSLSSRLDLKISQHGRYLDITYSDPYLKNFQGGIALKLPENFYAAAHYRRDHVHIQDTVYNENRISLETGCKTKAAEKWDFDVRFRTEIREYEEEIKEDHLRFRLRLRLRSELNIGKLRLKPFVAVETFGKSKIFSAQASRFYLGTFFPLSEHVEFGINYIWLATRGAESIHILHSGFELKF